MLGGRRRAAFLVAACASLIPTHAWSAGSETLVENCRTFLQFNQAGHPSITDELASVSCKSYVTGFINGWRHHEILTGSEDLFCIPSSVKVPQIIEVYVKWSTDNPERRHLGTWDTLYSALADGFPCQDG